MIRTIALLTGGSHYAKAAEELALRLAQACRARLRAVVAVDQNDIDQLSAETNGGADNARQLTEQDANRVAEKAEALGIRCETAYHGQGVHRGLTEESRQSDLLVLGIPTRADAQADPMARQMLRERIQMVRRAECSLLATLMPRERLDPLLLCYEGGLEGKAALRVGAEIAERAGLAVYLMPLADRPEFASPLIAAAREYLAGFDIPSLQTLEPDYSRLPESQILAATGEVAPNLIVLGSTPHNALQRFFGENTAEELTKDCDIPVLLAR